MLYQVLLVAYVIVAIMLIGIVLIQQGKGAGMGASFGAGGSNTVFGSSGAGNFMTRTTAILATLFFVLSLVIGNQSSSQTSVQEDSIGVDVPALEQPVEQPVESDVPVAQKEESDVPPSA